jgi:hypothetical protein
MKQLSLSRMVAVACILCASSAGASAASNKHGNDPARWYKGDSSDAQRMQILKKELNAAYAEQTAACKKMKSGKQSACLKQARANFQRDSANARQLVANAPQSSVTERVVSVTPAGGQDTTPGATAVGSSGAAGQTGAGAGTNPAMTGSQQSGAPQTGAPAGYGSSQSTGATTPPTQSGTQSGSQSGYGTSGAQSGYSSSGAGATSASGNQSGADNSNSQSGTGTTQSIGAGTGATQSDTQDQPRAGAVPPVQR